ncbi:hypothetical protein DPEC_G00150600 [Dallia pectoralis]|uniref:Uncharacterized protein n=1 Tax=Dallia pectoralis TaxID=75939 RepID=A0ACC2GJE4_DALPE|nr:hypothetical protein DPEC_G00150600 [Dallia pectoralis]
MLPASFSGRMKDGPCAEDSDLALGERKFNDKQAGEVTSRDLPIRVSEEQPAVCCSVWPKQKRAHSRWWDTVPVPRGEIASLVTSAVSGPIGAVVARGYASPCGRADRPGKWVRLGTGRGDCTRNGSKAGDTRPSTAVR